ncbi:MAG: hypothetical protein HY646_01360 [Acidobacteria bacterium]|nr:hypothetical protein [Acidobacteriota bacterium]
MKGKKSKDVLDHLTGADAECLLRELLRRHPGLRQEVGTIARDLVADVSVEDVRAEVSESLRSVGLDELNDRAGSHSWGYVEPSEAAWELLEEAVEEFLEDMKRRKEAGLEVGAEKVCQGVILGLFDVRQSRNEGALGWAPDFPAESAGQALADFIAMFPRSEKARAGRRILTGLGEQAAEWTDMLERVIAKASK